MTMVYHYNLETGEVNTMEGSSLLPVSTVSLIKQVFGENGVVYFHNTQEWLQWHPGTMRMHIDANEVPLAIRALHLIHSGN